MQTVPILIRTLSLTLTVPCYSSIATELQFLGAIEELDKGSNHEPWTSKQGPDSHITFLAILRSMINIAFSLQREINFLLMCSSDIKMEKDEENVGFAGAKRSFFFLLVTT